MAYPIGRRPNLPEAVNKGELRKLRTLLSEGWPYVLDEGDTVLRSKELQTAGGGRLEFWERGVSVRANFVSCYL